MSDYKEKAFREDILRSLTGMFREVLDRNPGITGAAAGRIIWDVLSYWVMANVDKYGKRKGREIPK